MKAINIELDKNQFLKIINQLDDNDKFELFNELKKSLFLKRFNKLLKSTRTDGLTRTACHQSLPRRIPRT